MSIKTATSSSDTSSMRPLVSSAAIVSCHSALRGGCHAERTFLCNSLSLSKLAKVFVCVGEWLNRWTFHSESMFVDVVTGQCGMRVQWEGLASITWPLNPAGYTFNNNKKSLLWTTKDFLNEKKRKKTKDFDSLQTCSLQYLQRNIYTSPPAVTWGKSKQPNSYLYATIAEIVRLQCCCVVFGIWLTIRRFQRRFLHFHVSISVSNPRFLR